MDKLGPSVDDAKVLHSTLLRWALWMRSGGMSERTIDARLSTIMLLAVRVDCDPLTCGWEPLSQFLADPRLTSQRSRVTYRGALSAWFGWLVRQGVRADNPVDMLPRMKSPRGVPHPVSTDQLAQALASGRYYRRTRSMIILAAYQGLRAFEIAPFRGEQIRHDQLRVIGKGDVEAMLPLHPMVAAEATRYPRIGFWFHTPGDPTRPVTAKNVSRVVGEALRRSGIDTSGHALRHWFVTQSLHSSGGNLRVAQELARHASPATTSGYTLIEDEQLAATVRALPVPLHAV